MSTRMRLLLPMTSVPQASTAVLDVPANKTWQPTIRTMHPRPPRRAPNSRNVNTRAKTTETTNKETCTPSEVESSVVKATDDALSSQSPPWGSVGRGRTPSSDVYMSMAEWRTRVHWSA